MPAFGVIELAFDPYLELGELAVRWQTIGVTLAILAGLAFAALIDGYLTADRPVMRQAPDFRPGKPANRLRLDDLGYVVLGSVPGAVVGGRIVHGLSFWEAYAADPLRLFDPSVGSLSLAGVVVGGTVTAAYVARVVGAPIRRWADAAAFPLLLTLALGKLAQLLGGSGQGAPWDGPWAVAFTGPGPWISPNAALPAHPAQLYEAVWLLAALPLLARWIGRRRAAENPVMFVPTRLRERPQGGRLFVLALGWFLLGRIVVGFTWRDEPILGPLNAEQAIAVVMLACVAIGLLVHQWRSLRPGSD